MKKFILIRDHRIRIEDIVHYCKTYNGKNDDGDQIGVDISYCFDYSDRFGIHNTVIYFNDKIIRDKFLKKLDKILKVKKL